MEKDELTNTEKGQKPSLILPCLSTILGLLLRLSEGQSKTVSRLSLAAFQWMLAPQTMRKGPVSPKLHIGCMLCPGMMECKSQLGESHGVC